MLKYLTLIVMIFGGAQKVKCQTADTVITYYKYFNGEVKQINTLDSADYITMTYPPDSSDSFYNIKEFYKNGRIKFTGKFSARIGNVYFLQDDCVSYYPNGKKQDVSHYLNGKKDGFEYFFNPIGRVSNVIKWVEYAGANNLKFYWECYDLNGNMLCENGNGKWIAYDNDFKNILQTGQVKKGLLDGKLYGSTGRADSIKYICDYSNGFLRSGISYDKMGKSHVFTKERRIADYQNGGIFNFIDDLKSHLKIPKDPAGNEINIDTVQISFIVEKDGRVTGLKVVKNIDDRLATALNKAVAKCDLWKPGTYFGIPCREKIIMPITISAGPYDNKNMHFNAELLDISLSDLGLDYPFD